MNTIIIIIIIYKRNRQENEKYTENVQNKKSNPIEALRVPGI
jgi:hypothetical protein